MIPRLRIVPRSRQLSRTIALLLACVLCGPSCGVVTAKQVTSSETRFAAAKGDMPTLQSATDLDDAAEKVVMAVGK